MEPGRGLTPFALAAWRISAGALIFWLLAVTLHRGRLGIRLADLPTFLGLALLGIVANQALYLTGLERSTAANAGLMMCTIPVFTFLVAVLTGQERFAWLRGLGGLISLLGLLPLMLGDGVSLGGSQAVGNLLIAANCLCYSIYLVGVRPFRERYSAVVMMAWVYLLSLPAVPWLAHGEDLLPAASDLSAWGSLAYVAIGPTVLAYLLNAFALGRVRASTSAFYIFTQPVISAVGGALLLEESLGVRVALAAAGLVPGMLMVLRKEAQ